MIALAGWQPLLCARRAALQVLERGCLPVGRRRANAFAQRKSLEESQVLGVLGARALARQWNITVLGPA